MHNVHCKWTCTSTLCKRALQVSLTSHLIHYVWCGVGNKQRVPWIIQLEKSFCTEESVLQRTAALIERHTLRGQWSRILAEQVLLKGELLLPFSEPLRHNFLSGCIQLPLPLLRSQLKTGPALTKICRAQWNGTWQQALWSSEVLNVL